MFEVRVAAPADRALGRLAPATVRRVEKALDALKEDPRRPRAGADIRLLRGRHGYFRLRVGPYRVFYFVDDDARRVTVVDIRHRSRAYD